MLMPSKPRPSKRVMIAPKCVGALEARSEIGGEMRSEISGEVRSEISGEARSEINQRGGAHGSQRVGACFQWFLIRSSCSLRGSRWSLT